MPARRDGFVTVAFSLAGTRETATAGLGCSQDYFATNQAACLRCAAGKWTCARLASDPRSVMTAELLVVRLIMNILDNAEQRTHLTAPTAFLAGVRRRWWTPPEQAGVPNPQPSMPRSAQHRRRVTHYIVGITRAERLNHHPTLALSTHAPSRFASRSMLRSRAATHHGSAYRVRVLATLPVDEHVPMSGCPRA